MAEILGIGCTHRPVMLRRNEDWTGMMKASLDDPDMPEEMKNPASWPTKLRFASHRLACDTPLAPSRTRSGYETTALSAP